MLSIVETAGKWTSGKLGRDSSIIRRFRGTYETLLNTLTLGRGLPYKINGELFRVSPYHRHLLAHDYDHEIASFLKQRVNPGSSCMVIGANIGIYAMQFARWSGIGGKVVAFEPNPAARKILQRHVDWNGFAYRVKVEGMAIGAEEGEINFFADNADGKGRCGAPSPYLDKNIQVFKVPMTTVSNYCNSRSFQPDWILFDIEGFEIDGLIGMEKYLKTSHSPLSIIMEMHPSLWTLSADTSRRKMEAALVDLSLKPIPLSNQKDVFAEHGMVFIECK